MSIRIQRGLLTGSAFRPGPRGSLLKAKSGVQAPVGTAARGENHCGARSMAARSDGVVPSGGRGAGQPRCRQVHPRRGFGGPGLVVACGLLTPWAVRRREARSFPEWCRRKARTKR